MLWLVRLIIFYFTNIVYFPVKEPIEFDQLRIQLIIVMSLMLLINISVIIYNQVTKSKMIRIFGW